jgi:hypothetical protein
MAGETTDFSGAGRRESATGAKLATLAATVYIKDQRILDSIDGSAYILLLEEPGDLAKLCLRLEWRTVCKFVHIQASK